MDGVRNGKVKQTPVNFGYYFKINVKPTKFHKLLLNQEKIELTENFTVLGNIFNFFFQKKIS
jgi:hypothetical protein